MAIVINTCTGTLLFVQHERIVNDGYYLMLLYDIIIFKISNPGPIIKLFYRAMDIVISQ